MNHSVPVFSDIKTSLRDIQIMDGAEIFLERLKEILRTEHRNSPHGAKNGLSVGLPKMLK